MSDELIFMMGQFEARFPTHLKYAKNHMWSTQRDTGVLRLGFSAYAVRLLQDVYFLEWHVDADSIVTERALLGAIESSKAESDLFAPLSGRLTRFNEELLSDPSAINVDKYGAGWLFEMEADESALLTAEEYQQHLAASWEVAQRTIKGQLN